MVKGDGVLPDDRNQQTFFPKSSNSALNGPVIALKLVNHLGDRNQDIVVVSIASGDLQQIVVDVHCQVIHQIS